MKRVSTVALALLAATAIAGSANADSISPSSYSNTLAVGGSVTISKTVTVTQQATAPVDIMFLADTTGSMSSTLSGVASGFSSILSSISGVASNVAFGVGDYKDVFDAYVYKEDVDLTTNTASVQAALSSLTATGGGDLPEGNLQGLVGSANNTTWRAGSDRYVVWVGDAPGHDPSGTVTEAGAIAALNAVGATVYAASATSGPGLDAACGGVDCTAGQATRIATATGGAFLGTFSPSSIVSAITAALTSGIGTYSNVSLVVSGLPAGVTVTFAPTSYTGSFDRSVDRTFGFDVTFTGLAAGIYDFTINAVLNGTTIIATETDHIEVTDVPEPSTMALIGLGLGIAGAARRRRAAKQAAI